LFQPRHDLVSSVDGLNLGDRRGFLGKTKQGTRCRLVFSYNIVGCDRFARAQVDTLVTRELIIT
jgi:hypothetical protein